MKKVLIFIAVLMAVAGGQAAAVPMVAGETYQVWTFDDADNPALPELSLNPYGTATAAVGGPIGPVPIWVATLLGRDGVWENEGLEEVVLEVPNQMIRNPYKEIYVEIGFLGDLVGFSIIPIPFGGAVTLIDQKIEVVDPVSNWKKLMARFIIEPNPDREKICYSFLGQMSAIDYVIVNTICVPEPLTISLLGFGGLMMWRRRRAA